jgi:hypothetical protein
MTNGTRLEVRGLPHPAQEAVPARRGRRTSFCSRRNQRESFRKALDEFDRGLKGLGEKIGRRLYRTQGGAIGQMANTTVNTTVIQLADKASVFNFHIGDTLTFSLTDGTGSLLDSGDTTTVTEVDHENGQVTVADNLRPRSPASRPRRTSSRTATTTSASPVSRTGCRSTTASRSSPRRSTPSPARRAGVPRRRLHGRHGMGGLDEVIIKLTGKIGKYGGRRRTSSRTRSRSRTSSCSPTRRCASSPSSTRRSSARRRRARRLLGLPRDRRRPLGQDLPGSQLPEQPLYALQLDTWTLWHTGELVNWLGESYTGSKLQPSQNEDSAEAPSRLVPEPRLLGTRLERRREDQPGASYHEGLHARRTDRCEPAQGDHVRVGSEHAGRDADRVVAG